MIIISSGTQNGYGKGMFINMANSRVNFFKIYIFFSCITLVGGHDLG